MAGPLNPRRIALLGATGSIGASALDVIARHPDRFELHAVSARSRVPELLAICDRFRPEVAVVSDESAYAALRDGLKDLGLATEARSGAGALDEVAASDDNDTVIAAIVGAAGVASTVAAARAGKRLLLANKESVVLAGAVLMRAASANNARIMPVDSEHNAIYQCMPGDGSKEGVRRLLLTASGGPFRGRNRSSLANVTADEACAHPNWVMGRKISVDSATLMNKGLEVIEARWLFDIPETQIEVLVHRESIIHSLVEYRDRSVIAQLGLPDMRTPISYAMRYPERMPLDLPSLDLTEIATLTFFKPDHDRFPCLQLGYDALRIGGTMPATMNAANEVAVEAFLQSGIRFLDIPDIIRSTMDAHQPRPIDGLDDALEADRWAREKAESLVHALTR